MKIFSFFILIIKSQTSVEWTEDLLSSNLSLFDSVNTNNSPLEIAKNLNFTIKNLELENFYNNNNGGLLKINVPIINYYLNNSILKNSTSTNGGAFFYNSYFPIYVFNCTFKDNNVTVHGGSIYMTSSMINTYSIINCLFENTYSGNMGGGIFISSAPQSFVNIYECTFFKCFSLSHGGALYIYSGNLALDISKICITNCFINTITSTPQGSILYIYSGSTFLSKIDYLSAYNCGKLGSSTGLIYFYGAEQRCQSLNFSNNQVHTTSAGHFIQNYASLYQFCNFLNSTSSTNYVLYFQFGNFQVDLHQSNIIGNDCKQYGIWAYVNIASRFFIKYCILINNLASVNLLYGWNGYSQTAKSCYIVYTGTWAVGFSDDGCIFSSSLTSTYLLTHYSTFLCKTPEELGILNININNEPCQTQPNIPTTCILITSNEQNTLISLTNILNILLIPLINNFDFYFIFLESKYNNLNFKINFNCESENVFS